MKDHADPAEVTVHLNGKAEAITEHEIAEARAVNARRKRRLPGAPAKPNGAQPSTRTAATDSPPIAFSGGYARPGREGRGPGEFIRSPP